LIAVRAAPTRPATNFVSDGKTVQMAAIPIKSLAVSFDQPAAVGHVHRRRPPAAMPLALVAAFATTMLAAAASAQTIEDKAQPCAACHGENGIPQEKTTPVISGQYQGYLYLELRDYKSGARKNDIMSPLAQTLERDDMMALALYFSKKPWPDLQQPPAPPDVAARAIRANASVGCTGCHQGQYQGEGTQPRLAGQSREYMHQTMLDFRTRKRGNNPGMTDLMLATSEEDIAALAQYMAGLQYIGGQQ
jgi:cytochrome c553